MAFSKEAKVEKDVYSVKWIRIIESDGTAEKITGSLRKSRAGVDFG